MSTEIERSNDEICEVQRRSSEIQEKVSLKEFAKNSHPIVKAKAANIINGLGPLRSTILPMKGAIGWISYSAGDNFQLTSRFGLTAQIDSQISGSSYQIRLCTREPQSRR